MEDLKAIRFVEGTKISHDYKDKEIKTFSYRELIDLKVPAIGIPCKQNNLVVIDIDVSDGGSHKHDGRAWWTQFVNSHQIPFTYCVRTRSGGYHIYFRLPQVIDPELFMPPKMLALGVDVKWNGWVGAPPTVGYSAIQGSIDTIADLPDCLLEEMSRQFKGGAPIVANSATFEAHKPFTPTQIEDIRRLLTEIQGVSSPSYAEWRDGLFSLKTGIQDQEVLEELATLWTYNRSYQVGDEIKALDIVRKSDSFGKVGPGTIFSLIGQIKLRENVPVNAISQTATSPSSPFTKQDVLDRSKVNLKFNDKGEVKIEPSETNVAQMVGAMYSTDILYHDIRQDLFIFNNQVHTEESLTNELTPILQSTAFGMGFEKIKKSTIKGGIEVLLSARKIDPHQRWLNSIKWDGVNRIDYFFPHYCKVAESDYVRAVSKNFWIMLAARGIAPGTKVDSIVIIEGAEGVRKSSLVQAIGGEYTFTPVTDRLMSDMDELRKMHQSVIVELPELMGLQNQDANKVKAFLTVSHDNIRDLFVRRATKRPRGFIIVGTTNNSQYLSRDMGERRFWPIRIPKGAVIDTDLIIKDREQLFAEAVHRFKAGEPFYSVEASRSEASRRVVVDPLAESIQNMFNGMYPPKISAYEMYNRLEVMGVVNRGYNSFIKERILSALYSFGYILEEGTNTFILPSNVDSLI